MFLITDTGERERTATGSDGAMPASAAVVFEHVSLAFDEHVLLRDVSFSVSKGTMRILLGASGTGKSVLLKLILGLLRPDSGRILSTAGASTTCANAISCRCGPASACCFRRTRCSTR